MFKLPFIYIFSKNMDGKLGFMFLHFRSLRNQMCLGANLLCKQTMPNGLTLDAFHKPL